MYTILLALYPGYTGRGKAAGIYCSLRTQATREEESSLVSIAHFVSRPREKRKSSLVSIAHFVSRSREKRKTDLVSIVHLCIKLALFLRPFEKSDFSNGPGNEASMKAPW